MKKIGTCELFEVQLRYKFLKLKYHPIRHTLCNTYFEDFASSKIKIQRTICLNNFLKKNQNTHLLFQFFIVSLQIMAWYINKKNNKYSKNNV